MVFLVLPANRVMPRAVGNTNRRPGQWQLIKNNVATANTSLGFTAPDTMLSSAKKRLYLCLDSRKRFLTDPVFTKSRNNWFFTRSVYPLPRSAGLPFPLEDEAGAQAWGASLPGAPVRPWGGGGSRPASWG